MARESDLLRDVGRLLTRSHDLEETLRNVVRLVAKWMHASACSIYVLDESDGALVLRATRGLNASSVGRVRMAVGEGVAGTALAARKAIAVEDAREDPRVRADPESGEHKFRGLLAVPLLVRSLPVGVLTVRTARKRAFATEDVELLEMIAAQVGSIVLNAAMLDLAAREGSGFDAPPGAAIAEPHAPGAVLSALPSSPGIAIGPVYHLPAKPDLSRVDYRPARSAAGEWRALRRALAESIRQLSDLRNAVGERFGEEFADVFMTHIMILEDQGFRGKLEDRVRHHGNAVTALSETARDYAAVFASTADATMRERAADIEDVTERVTAELLGLREHNPPLRDGVVVVADRLAPSEFVRLETEKVAGLVIGHGGPTSHAAIFARSLEIPAVSGFGEGTARFAAAREVIVDGLEGRVIVDPTNDQRNDYAERIERLERSRHRLDEMRDLPTHTLDGREVRLSANIGGLYDMDLAERYGVTRVGLLRTEILALAARGFPDEEEQRRNYARIAARAAPEGVTIRAFDLGGDKAMHDADPEPNPQLGLRSIRLLLAQADVLRTQLRAVFRANTLGNLRFMVPMVTSIEELDAAIEIVSEVHAELGGERVPFGVMVETPAAVGLAPHIASRVDFLSIGSNDLIQYTLAADRENEAVAGVYDPFHPVVLASLRAVSRAAMDAAIPHSLCGELAGSPAATPLLIGLGIEELSMTPLLTLGVRQMIRSVDARALDALADEVLGLPRATDVRARISEAYEAMGLFEDLDLGPELRRSLPGGPAR